MPIDPVVGAFLADGKLNVLMNGKYVRAETDFGLSVENDGVWTALVKLPTSFRNMTNGLCGNNNGDAGDDLTTSDGEDVTGLENSFSIWGNSWQVEDPEDKG